MVLHIDRYYIVMSGTFFGKKENSNEEVLYGPTDTEDTNTTITSNEKHCSRKRSTTESDSEVTPTRQPKKKVFISEHIGKSKSTEDKTTDANTSITSTVKHWRRNFQPRVAHQQITSSLKKSGYRSGFNPQDKKTLNKAKQQPTKYFSDSETGVVDYLEDYHTPTGLVDHKYSWQAKQQETAKLNKKHFTIQESGSAISDTMTPFLTHSTVTTHNVQTKVAAVYEQCFGTLQQGNTNYLIFRKIIPPHDECSTYFIETNFITHCGCHPSGQPYCIGLHIVNQFNREPYNIKRRIELNIHNTWCISTVRYDSSYTHSKNPL
jgi:hypothetical protein